MPTLDYLNSVKGQKGRHLSRKRKRVTLFVDGIEPRSKKAMPEDDKRNFRKQILEHLRARKKRPFKGPIALQISATTSDRNPAHAQTIAKNLLDLLGRHSAGEALAEPLIYSDDSQIGALSVVCTHGGRTPAIEIEAVPFRYFLADLDLAAYASNELGANDDERERGWSDDSIQELKTLLRDDGAKRFWGAKAYEAWVTHRKRQAQQHLLRNGVSLWDLAQLFGVYGEHQIFPNLGSRLAARSLKFRRSLAKTWEHIFHRNPLRIRLDELPQKPGTSSDYRKAIDVGMEELRGQFDWIMDPLLTPVSLEVVVKPPRAAVRSANDLDNVLRDYLLPKFIDAFKPPSDIRWTFESETVRNGALPKSTRIGITRYEAWRLQRWTSDRSHGYVSVSLVADPYRSGSLFDRIDRTIDKWAENEGDD